MKRSRFSEEEIIGVQKEAEATTVKATCAKRNISEATYYGWRKKYGGEGVNEEGRVGVKEEENGRVKKVGGEHVVENQNLKKEKSKKKDEQQAGDGEGKKL